MTQQQLPTVYQAPEDEISLVDLLLVLGRHKRAIILVTALITAMGVAAALLLPQKYTYKTVIEVGSILVTDNNGTTRQYIEDINTVSTKVKERFIVNTLLQEPDENFAIASSSPKDSNLIILTTKAKDSDKKVLSLHANVASLLGQEHGTLVKDFRRKLELEKTQLDFDLAALQSGESVAKQRQALLNAVTNKESALNRLTDERFFNVDKIEAEKGIQRSTNEKFNISDRIKYEKQRSTLRMSSLQQNQQLELSKAEEQFAASSKLLKNRINSINDQKKLLDTQLKAIKSDIADLSAERRKASQNAGNSAANAMTVILIDNELQQTRKRLNDIEERLYIDLDKESFEIQTKLSQLIAEHKLNTSTIKQNYSEKIALEEKQIEQALAELQRNQSLQDRQIAESEAKLTQLLTNRELRVKQINGELEEAKNSLAKFEFDLEQKISDTQAKIRSVENQLTNIQMTRAVVQPHRSKTPTSVGRKIIVIGAGFAGLMLGLFAAFALELATQVRKRQREGAAV